MNEDNGVIEQIKKLLEQDQRETAAMRGAASALPRRDGGGREPVNLDRIEASLGRIETALGRIAAAATRPPGVK